MLAYVIAAFIVTILFGASTVTQALMVVVAAALALASVGLHAAANKSMYDQLQGDDSPPAETPAA